MPSLAGQSRRASLSQSPSQRSFTNPPPEHMPDEPSTPPNVIDNESGSAMADLLAKVSDDGKVYNDESSHAAQQPGAQDAESSSSEPAGGDLPDAGGTQSAAEAAGKGQQAADQPGNHDQSADSAGTLQDPQVADAEDDWERDIVAQEPPRGASTKSVDVINHLKRLGKDEHRAKKALEKQLQEAQAREILDSATKQELTELRRRADIRAVEVNPQFNEKYVAPLQKHETQAIGIMQANQLPAETAQLIQQTGGLLAFKHSDRGMPVGSQDLNGKPFVGTRAEWYKAVMEPIINDLPNAVKSRLSYHLGEAERAAFARDEALQEVRANPQKFIEEQRARMDEELTAYASDADDQLAKESDLYGEIAKPLEIPKDATKEKVAEIKQHNARLDAAREGIRKGFADGTARHRASAEVALAYRDLAQEHVKGLQKKLDETIADRDHYKNIVEKAKGSAQITRQQSNVQQQAQKGAQPYTRGFKSEDDARGISELMSQVAEDGRTFVGAGAK